MNQNGTGIRKASRSSINLSGISGKKCLVVELMQKAPMIDFPFTNRSKPDHRTPRAPLALVPRAPLAWQRRAAVPSTIRSGWPFEVPR